MSSITRYAIVPVLLLSFAVFSAAANCQTAPTTKVVTGTIAGRITIKGKGAPGIVVIARRQESQQQMAPLRNTTDQDGYYRIVGLTAGSYLLRPLAPAYAMPDENIPRFGGKTVLLAEGEDVQGVDFSLVRGGVIAGKVTDADGRPLIEERLTIVPDDQGNWRGESPLFQNRFQTDDSGVYRIYGIPAGRYRIFVGLAEEDPYSSTRLGRATYKRTYYPDATEPGKAKLIEVNEGAEALNIDITVGRSLPTFAASGNVVDGETGHPIGGLRFGLRRMVGDREGGYVEGMGAVSNSRGEFRMENVTPGKYAIFITQQAAGTEVRAEASHFEIDDKDVTGILIKTVKGLSVSGTIVLEGNTDRTAYAKLAELRVSAFMAKEMARSGQHAPINPDGSFRIGGLLAGNANFWISAQEGRRQVNFNIVRVERDGVVQRGGLEIKPGEQVTGVKLVVSYGTGVVRGEVQYLNGPLPAGGRLDVWIRKVSETDSNSRSQNIDSRGHFRIEGVSAGSYDLHVNAHLPGGRAVPWKQSISVSEGAVSDVVVILDLNPGQLTP
jgi:hypothetical protein